MPAASTSTELNRSSAAPPTSVHHVSWASPTAAGLKRARKASPHPFAPVPLYDESNAATEGKFDELVEPTIVSVSPGLTATSRAHSQPPPPRNVDHTREPAGLKR